MITPLRPEDAPDLMSLARAWLQPAFQISPGAHGAVARADDGHVLAFGLLRETAYGFVVDELWEEQSREGLHALVELAAWLEDTDQRIARERGVPFLSLGGLVRLDNPVHKAALEKRGYTVVAEAMAKEIYA